MICSCTGRYHTTPYNYTYFCDEDEREHAYGKDTLSLPALGVILVQRERQRNMELSIVATHCGVEPTKEMRERMEYAWAYAKYKEEKGQKGAH